MYTPENNRVMYHSSMLHGWYMAPVFQTAPEGVRHATIHRVKMLAKAAGQLHTKELPHGKALERSNQHSHPFAFVTRNTWRSWRVKQLLIYLSLLALFANCHPTFFPLHGLLSWSHLHGSIRVVLGILQIPNGCSASTCTFWLQARLSV